MNTDNIKKYAAKNWKSIALVIVLACLILFNVKQYQHSIAVVAENTKINTMYLESLKREDIYNQQIANYQKRIDEKNQLINLGKLAVEETEQELQVSQNEAKRLSRIILNRPSKQPIDEVFVKTCDSLATVAPILSDQVDTLKKQNRDLVQNLEDKSQDQDSIISIKDKIITDKQELLNSAIKSYNQSVSEYLTVEKKLNKAKKAKNFWVKATIVVGAALAGTIAIK